MDRPGPSLAALALAVLASGCAPVNHLVDHLALAQLSALAAKGPAEPGPALPFSSDEELEALTRPPAGEALAVEVTPEPDALQDVRLSQERLTFESAVHLRHPSSDRAVAHAFRRGPWGSRPVVLWVPGVSIGRKHWESLSRYFGLVLEAGADVVLYEPPYHFSRAVPGTGSGDAFLSAGCDDHLAVFVQELSDLRRLVRWLRGQGVTILGGFGSSMGGGMLLRTATFESGLDFLVLKQPLLDWSAVLARPEMEPARRRIEAQVPLEAMKRAWRALDPRSATPRTSPARISILYGRFDLIAPEEQVLSLAERWGVTDLHGYPRGHSTIMVGGQPYLDVPWLVRRHVRAVRILRGGR